MIRLLSWWVFSLYISCSRLIANGEAYVGGEVMHKDTRGNWPNIILHCLEPLSGSTWFLCWGRCYTICFILGLDQTFITTFFAQSCLFWHKSLFISLGFDLNLDTSHSWSTHLEGIYSVHFGEVVAMYFLKWACILVLTSWVLCQSATLKALEEQGH